MKALLFAAALPFLAIGFSGCSNPINAYTGRRYFEAAQQAEAAGDLPLARRNYSRALGNAEMGSLGPAAKAHCLYEYARVTGYLGLVDEAQKSFAEVLTLIEQAKGEVDNLRAPTLVENARVLDDNGDPAKASIVYAQALAALDHVQAESADPIGFALFLDAYARSLSRVGARDRSNEIAARAAAIRQGHPGEKARFHNVRRYAQAGRAASERNDWATARRYWERAVTEAEAAGVSADLLATACYEYGRSLGVMGEFADAEKYLNQALAIDEANGGTTYMDLTELARLNYDQHKYAEAAAYYAKELPLLEAKGGEQRSPADMIDLLTEYADCLGKLGRGDEANEALARSRVIRSRTPEMNPPSDRTPYGKYTPAASASVGK